MTARYAAAMWLLVGLFALRVVAQPLALVMRFLPPFESWHSAALPYGVLLLSQLIILTTMGATTWRLNSGLLEPRRSRGVLALTLGTVYFLGMAARLVLGFTVLSHVRWFASPLPTVFHLVLAGWVLLFGAFHLRGGDPVSGR